MADLSDPVAERILAVVRRREMDGYSLMSYTGYDLLTIEKALEGLLKQKLIAVRGAKSGPELGDSWIYVPLGSKGLADQALS